VPPAQFIPIAEQTGLILQIGEWVLRSACAQLRQWHLAGYPDLGLAVNVSARQLRQQDFPGLMQQVLKQNQLDPRCLELEITESILLDESQGFENTLRRLKGIGVNLSLDDFGTGYSSLSYLRRFPIDIVKIDRSFVREVTTNADDASITDAIIAMARSLGMRTVAEGVETEAQARFMRAHRCDAIQGYYVSPALPAAALRTWLDTRRQAAPAAADVDDGRRTLLLLDDEPNVVSALKRVLRTDGYCILGATTPTEAFALLATHPVGVIVCDQRMPVMTGIEFLRNIKKLYPEAIRIILTGYTDLRSVAESVNEGAIYKFLTKPWDDRELRANIVDAFRQHEMATERGCLDVRVPTPL
jgi:EAL domain-containing protein (putative c-di-GMP-specific phosphodiesterase class I)/CheY-like chemotaxis protein